MRSQIVKKVPMETESYTSLGVTIILLALFAQRYQRKYTPKTKKTKNKTRISQWILLLKMADQSTPTTPISKFFSYQNFPFLFFLLLILSQMFDVLKLSHKNFPVNILLFDLSYSGICITDI